MKRILFVDDEQQVLDGLRDLFRKDRRRWEMSFALGGRAALAELGRASFDVIVSDMRMPGVDGAQVLQYARDNQPAAARVVLSGHADAQAVLRSLPVAQQFLSKPADAETIRAAIDRLCALQDMVPDAAVRRLVGSLESLPCCPDTQRSVARILSNPRSTLVDLACVVESDPALSAKVLQLANSSFFGLGRSIMSVRRGLSHLGMDLMRDLLSSPNRLCPPGSDSVSGLSLSQLSCDSLAVSHLAQELLSNRDCIQETAAVAVVHDIGKIVIALVLRESYVALTEEARSSGRAQYIVERERLGSTHAEIGAYLLGTWGLPAALVDAVAYHHEPRKAKTATAEVLAAIHGADTILAAASNHEPIAQALHRVDMDFLEQAGDEEFIVHWSSIAKRTLSEFAEK